jgi:hypothetical protein
MTFREEFIKALMKARKIGRARAEEIYARREARPADSDWHKVEPDNEDESPEAR